MSKGRLYLISAPWMYVLKCYTELQRSLQFYIYQKTKRNNVIKVTDGYIYICLLRNWFSISTKTLIIMFKMTALNLKTELLRDWAVLYRYRFLNFMYMNILPAYMCVLDTYAWYTQTSEECYIPLELTLRMAVNHHMSTSNWAWIDCKSNACLYLSPLHNAISDFWNLDE